MSLWSRITNVFRGDGPSREIDEELQSHIDEALEHGRDPSEARRAFGSRLRRREDSRDIRLIVWLDALRADAVFGWRQLMKRKIASVAAILSLALATGACTSAFRLLDALLLLCAVRVWRDESDRPAKQMFGFSILYLFLLFASLLAEAITRVSAG